MTLKVKQESTYQGGEWWKWSVSLAGSPRDLAAVDHVVYTLHPTFPEPIQTVRNRRTGFKLDSSGWGEFEIYLQVVLGNGKVRKRRHWLTLPYPEGQLESGTARRAPIKGLAVYVSSGPADALTARKLRDALKRVGLVVSTFEDAPADLPPETGLDRLLASVDAAVFLLSGRPSLWCHTEIEHALARKVAHVIPVVIGTRTEVPPSLKETVPFQLESPDELDSLVTRIVDAARPPG